MRIADTRASDALASILIPVYNEAAHIERLLTQLVACAPPEVLEFIVADGRSVDGTRDIVAKMSGENAKIRLVDNPERDQASGVNLAAQAADKRSTILIRIDAHASYSADFISGLIGELERCGADSVVVRMRSVGRGCFQRAVAAVSNSWLGTGGSRHRVGGASGFVDHGHHAVFRRAAFQRLGGYDASFVPNEDSEFDARLRASGGRIWFCADLEVDYFPRSSPKTLWIQYFRYGKARIRTAIRHKEIKLRQCLPPVAILGLVLSALSIPWTPWAVALPAVYAMFVGVAALRSTFRSRDICQLAIAVAAPVMHVAWALGFFAGGLAALAPRRPAA